MTPVSFLTKTFASSPVASRGCYSSRPRRRRRRSAGARGNARSEGLDVGGADDTSPVARLASHELSPSITPCPSGLGVAPAPAPVPAPGSVGVRPPVGGAVDVPGPPDDFTLHVVVKKMDSQSVKRTRLKDVIY